METKPAALVVAPEAPYPAMGGGALRSAALIEYLARRYELDVVVFRQPGDPDPTHTRLRELSRRIGVIALPRHSRRPLARAVRNLRRAWKGVPPLVDRFAGFEAELVRLLGGRRYEVAVVEHFWCAPYVAALTGRAERTVLNLHNIESALHGSYAETGPWPVSVIHHRFQQACRDLERRWLPRYSLVLVTSEQDAVRVREISPAARLRVYPNTIPLRPAPPRQEADLIAFSGNMEYQPNLDAVRFFHQRIWPRLRARWPRLRWTLIGRNPQAVTRYVAGALRVELRGPVTDAVAELAAAKVAVVPLLAGSGTRVKILEAWAAATPVVSTSIGCEGLPVTPGRHLLVADEPAEFAEAVSALLASERLRRQIGRAGRELYEREFTWEAGWRRLADSGL